jgi:hypothetical protein
MDGKIKQCACIKFCVKLGKSITASTEMLRKAFEEHSLTLQCRIPYLTREAFKSHAAVLRI